MLKTAVLDDSRLIWRDVKGTLVWEANPGPSWAGRFCEHALRNGLHTIWVTPGSGASRQVFNHPDSIMFYSVGEYDVRLKFNDNGVPVFGSVKRKIGTWEEKRLVYFGFPEHDPRWMTDGEDWALADIEDSLGLLDVITSTERALTPFRVVRGCMQSEPFHLAYSPGYSGMDLFKKVIKLYGHVAWMSPADVSGLPTASEPGGFVWKRELTPAEREKIYIHFFDRNFQFTAAATGAECGEGTPDYYPPGLMHRPNLKLPGVWKVSVAPPEAYNLCSYLPSFPTGEQWAYTPTIQAMEALGYYVEFLEGYQWTRHHRTLQEWAKHCWEARKQLREKFGKNSPQEHLAKMIVNRGMGWFDLGAVRQEKRTSEPTNRPDWYHMVRSLARYRMVLKLIEFSEQGQYPVMVVADNIAYVSNEVNPELVAPGLMNRSNELGGFKHDGTYLLSEVLPLMEQYSPNDVRKHVKQLKKLEVQ